MEKSTYKYTLQVLFLSKLWKCFENNVIVRVKEKVRNVVRLKKRQVWHIRSPIYLLEMGFIIQPTTGGLLWCAVNIWVVLPIKASAFFLLLIYCHSSSAQTASWNLCQSTNDTVFVIWVLFFLSLSPSYHLLTVLL